MAANMSWYTEKTMAGMRADATLGWPKTPFIPKCSVKGRRGNLIIIIKSELIFRESGARAAEVTQERGWKTYPGPR
jgi:hypothetical protein